MTTLLETKEIRIYIEIESLDKSIKARVDKLLQNEIEFSSEVYLSESEEYNVSFDLKTVPFNCKVIITEQLQVANEYKYKATLVLSEEDAKLLTQLLLVG